MLYLIAILVPPLAVLLCGKPLQFLLNLALCLCFWVPGIVHAVLVVNAHLADKRTEKIVEAIERQRS